MPDFDYSSIPGFFESVSGKLDTTRMHALFTIMQFAIQGVEVISNAVAEHIENEDERRLAVQVIVEAFNHALQNIGLSDEEKETLQSVLHGFDTLRNRVNNTSMN